MQQVWRKRWRNTGWLALGAITLVLLVSAVNKKNHKLCKGIEVTFKGDGNNFFIEEKGVEGVLKANSAIVGQPVETINLRALEGILKNDKWIARAELFFDNNQILQAVVEEKTAVARIFTTAGSSFYIDSACRRLPLSEKLSARIPMFTNFPSDRTPLSRPDSMLLASVKGLAMFIQADDFWKAQAAQIDITPDGFEMIPTIGSHRVELGGEGDWQHKFDRLFSFYKQVWTKVGFEKYEKVDVRFNGQVVATIKGTKPAMVDSSKVRIAYDDLFDDVKNDGDSINTQVAMKDSDIKMKRRFIKKKPVSLVNVSFRKTLRKPEVATTTAKKVIAKNQNVKTPDLKQPNVKKETVRQPSKQAPAKAAVATTGQTDSRKVPKAVMKKSGDF